MSEDKRYKKIIVPIDGSGQSERAIPHATDIAGAAIDAARFVYALMSDGVCVTVDYLDGRCVGSSHFFLDAENLTPDTVGRSQTGIRGGNIRTERFIWSGPV